MTSAAVFAVFPALAEEQRMDAKVLRPEHEPARPRPPDAGTQPTGQSTGVIGRDVESTVLGGALASLAAGRGLTVLIEGEAGIGKSALLAAMLSRIDPGECQVLRGGWDELAQRFPLSAMSQVLGFEPTRHPAEPAAGTGAPSDDPVTAVLEQLLGRVRELCARGPVVLALEDLQWADDASLLCWQRLCRATTQMPLLLVGTRRPVSARGPESRLRHDVQSHGGLLMSLGGLTQEAVAAMAADLVHGTPGRRLLQQLAGAAGNPFYIRELLNTASRSGALRVGDGVAELTERPPGGACGGPALLVASLQDSMMGRLGSSLSGDVMDVLRVAALLGTEFSVSELAAVTERTAVALMAMVEDAIAAGLLESSSVGPRLRFRHALLQQALYETMPAPLRQALDRQVALALIEARAPAERIAQHLLPAPDTVESWEVNWLMVNAAALTRRVPEAAADLLERALRHTPSSDARRGRLEDQLAHASFLLGRYQQVEQTAQAILARTTDRHRRGRATWLHGYALLRMRRYEEAIKALEIAAARPDVLPVWHARFGVLRAMVLRGAERWADAEHAAVAALAEGRESGDATAVAYALHALSIQRMYANDPTDALHLIDEALSLTGEDGQLADLRALLLVNRQGTAMDLGRFGEASALARQALADNELSGSPRLGTLRMQAGLAAYETGDWDEAAAELEAVTDVEVNRRDELHALRALLAGHRDDQQVARRHLTALRRAIDDYGPEPAARPDSHHNSLVLAAWALESEWAPAAGEARKKKALSPHALWLELGTGGQAQHRYKILPTVVRSALAAQDEPTARAAARAAWQEAALNAQLKRPEVTAQWCDGLVRGDPAAVLAVAKSFREMGLVLNEGEALEDAAMLTAQAGETSAARTLLDEALRIYTGLGAHWDARRAGSRLRQLGVHSGVRGPRRPRPATGWQALTAMELQVARLMAAGLSNPDIAAQLLISRRTVESHASRILAKLQVASRWEVEVPAE